MCERKRALKYIAIYNYLNRYHTYYFGLKSNVFIWQKKTLVQFVFFYYILNLWENLDTGEVDFCII